MRRLFLLVFIAACGTGLLPAGEPWKEKKYTEWSDKDIEKVLFNSPWARTVSIALSGPGMGGDIGRRERGGGGGLSGLSGGEGGDPGAAGAGGRSRIDDFGGSPRRELQLLLRWQSALPVRQAMARRQMQSGKMTTESAERFVGGTPDRYVLVLSGIPPTALAGVTPQKLKAVTVLKRGQAAPIALEDVRMEQGPSIELYFVFPRAAAPLTAADKSVEFVTTLGRFEIRKKFSFKDMLIEGKPEL